MGQLDRSLLILRHWVRQSHYAMFAIYAMFAGPMNLIVLYIISELQYNHIETIENLPFGSQGSAL